jgi:hypothetical protein
MRQALGYLKIGLKYGAWILVIVDVLEYAIGKIEAMEKPKEDEKLSEQS